MTRGPKFELPMTREIGISDRPPATVVEPELAIGGPRHGKPPEWCVIMMTFEHSDE